MEELKEAGIYLVSLPKAAQRSSWSQTGVVWIDASADTLQGSNEPQESDVFLDRIKNRWL